LIVLNNGGYLSIKTTQDRAFKGDYIGTHAESGVSFPPLQKIAEAYGIPYIRLASAETLEAQLEWVFQQEGPVICDAICGGEQEVAPCMLAQKDAMGNFIQRPLEDMYPFLEEEEYLSNMYIKPIYR